MKRKSKSRISSKGFFIGVACLWILSLANFYYSNRTSDSVSANTDIDQPSVNTDFFNESKWKINKDYIEDNTKFFFRDSGIVKYSISRINKDKNSLYKAWYPNGVLKEVKVIDEQKKTKLISKYNISGLAKRIEKKIPFLILTSKLDSLVSGVPQAITKNIRSTGGESMYQGFAHGEFNASDKYGSILSEFNFYRGFVTGPIVGVRHKFRAFYNKGILSDSYKTTTAIPEELRSKSNRGIETGHYNKNGVLDGEIKVFPYSDDISTDSNPILTLNIAKGNLNGNAFAVTSSGLREDISFIDNSINGLQRITSPDGKKLFTANYNKGNLNGKVTEWFTNQRIKYTGNCKDNYQSGKFKYYSDKGSKKAELNYIKGKLSGTQTLYSYNTVYARFNYKTGHLNGKFIVYHSNGATKIRGNYLSGQLHGIRQTFNKKGNLVSKGIFNKGKLKKPIEIYLKNGRVKSLVTSDPYEVKLDELVRGIDKGYLRNIL